MFNFAFWPGRLLFSFVVKSSNNKKERWGKARQEKTRQDKPKARPGRKNRRRQVKIRQDKRRRDKTRHDKVRQGKTRQDQRTQDKTREDKRKQEKTREGKWREEKRREGKGREGKRRKGQRHTYLSGYPQQGNATPSCDTNSVNSQRQAWRHRSTYKYDQTDTHTVYSICICPWKGMDDSGFQEKGPYVEGSA